MKSRLEGYIFDQRQKVIDIQTALTATQALGPENGGQGEKEKALLVSQLLPPSAQCIWVNSPDPRVESGERPNLIAIINGHSQRKLWLFGHLDVVPPGDLNIWESDPWQARCVEDNIFGRGVEDNQQAITSMLILANSLEQLNIVPELGLGLVFMADEECGSRHGLEWILRQKPELFSKDDFYIVPDGGSKDGRYIEVAEKAQLWLKFTVIGKQCHASTPHIGKNAFVAASWLVLQLNALNISFPQKNTLFHPPISTFVPTKHPQNVDAINIIPGKDIFYMDCRLLPELSKEDLFKVIEEKCMEAEKQFRVKIEISIEQEQPASSVSIETPLMNPLKSSIAAIYNVKAQPVGIGGATVASFLRQRNLPALVWACLQNTCHQPNEYSSILATLKDTAVFADLIMAAENA